MTHPEIEADLKAFLDGELPFLRRFQIAQHLRNCPHCQQEIEIMEQLSQTLNSDESKESLSPDLRAKILQNAPVAGPVDRSVAAPDFSPKPFKPRVKYGEFALLASLCLVVGLGVLTLSGRRLQNSFGAAANTINTATDEDYGAAAAGAPLPDAAPPSANSAFRDSISAKSREVLPGETARQIHRAGSLSLSVSDIEKSSAAVENLVANVGGFIAQNSLSTGANNARVAELEVRVPTEKFNEIVRKVGQLGLIRAKNISGEDITARYVGARAGRDELNRQLAILEAKLRAAKSGSEKRATLEYQVAALRAQTASARAQFESLKKLATLADLSISLEEKAKTPAPATFSGELGQTGRQAWSSFQNAARLPLQLLIWIAAYSPLWLPALFVWKKWGRKWLMS